MGHKSGNLTRREIELPNDSGANECQQTDTSHTINDLFVAVIDCIDL
jgi:hypothetical protein